jgi:hypothetical protein
MFISNYASRARIASGTSILLGIWLLVSPWVFGYQVDGAPAIWNSVTVGGAVARAIARTPKKRGTHIPQRPWSHCASAMRGLFGRTLGTKYRRAMNP